MVINLHVYSLQQLELSVTKNMFASFQIIFIHVAKQELVNTLNCILCNPFYIAMCVCSDYHTLWHSVTNNAVNWFTVTYTYGFCSDSMMTRTHYNIKHNQTLITE